MVYVGIRLLFKPNACAAVVCMNAAGSQGSAFYHVSVGGPSSRQQAGICAGLSSSLGIMPEADMVSLLRGVVSDSSGRNATSIQLGPVPPLAHAMAGEHASCSPPSASLESVIP